MPSNATHRKPPKKSRNVFTDIGYFLLHRPRPVTQLKFASEEERDNYNKRILQRLGVTPDDYTILNIHQIGVDAPVQYVFNELLKWSGESTCWPNHIAKIDRIDNNLEHIRILPFGWPKYPFGMKSLFGLNLIPLFLLNVIRFKSVPDSFDFDNARYLLYSCSGGYPIGFFSMYVRSSIPDAGETDSTRLFIIVGFNFYGRKGWAKKGPINQLWQMIHNRVTTNVIHRLKVLCEWRFEMIHRQPDLRRHFEFEEPEPEKFRSGNE